MLSSQQFFAYVSTMSIVGTYLYVKICQCQKVMENYLVEMIEWIDYRNHH